MRTLFSYVLCPFSRKVRLVLEELKYEYHIQNEPIWKRREDFLDLNHTGEVPVFIDFIDEKPVVITQSQAICEYLHDSDATSELLPQTPLERARVRQKCLYFDLNFYKDVVHKIVFEKALKRQMGLGSLDSKNLREGQTAMKAYLEHLSWNLENNDWLCGSHLTLADLVAAAHLSCLDYFGAVSWSNYPDVKDWYARLKSRPSFRPLLKDAVPGFSAAPHYTDLDF